MNTCQCGKIPFESRAKAKDTIKKMREKGHRTRTQNRRPLEPYACPTSKYWHVGHKPNRVNQRRAKRNGTYHSGPTTTPAT